MSALFAEITPEQKAEMKRIKAFFPYRIVYIALLNDEWIGPAAVFNKRQINAILREGGSVWTL